MLLNDKQSVIGTLKILSVLLRYPDENLITYAYQFIDVLKDEGFLKKKTIYNLKSLINYFYDFDLLKLQEQYVALFDRQKQFSLYFFEHVYGDSGDRGQAMINLKNIYRASNLVTLTSELPDYIPLFLEYLCMLSYDEARQFLSVPINIFTTIGRRLQKINSHYRFVFYALDELSFVKADELVVQNALAVATKGLKFTTEMVDSEWEEKQVFN